MNLPRGSFHSIKKGILFRSLLDEIEKAMFTGYCTVSCGMETCTLVLNLGIYILADYDKLEGEQAWQKTQKLLDMKVDAGLTTLTAIQLQLAKEFNPHATLPSFVRKSPTRQVRTEIISSGTRRQEDSPRNAIPEARLEHQEKQGLRPGPETVVAGTHPAQQLSTRGTLQSPDEQRATEKGPENNGSDIDRDLETLDNMDIDEMTKKIRENCKITIEHLDLDYLVKKRDD